jgi:inorganic pyrophosphatase
MYSFESDLFYNKETIYMNLQLTAGEAVPKELHAVIEIAALSPPVKYEVDKTTGRIMVDRFLPVAMQYPCNYGYIPATLGGDGDPLDILVMTPYPVQTGAVLRCRPIGLLNMEDESGEDAKILAVPINTLSLQYQTIQSPADLSEHFKKTLQHFFEHYKDLEPGKWVKIKGWAGVEAAHAEILQSIKRYQEQG